MDAVSIHLEFTPNPNTLKFVVNRELLPKGAVHFGSADKADKAPLAKVIFEVPGVAALLVGTNFVTVTKADDGDWDILAERVPLTMERHIAEQKPNFDADFEFEAPAQPGVAESEIETKIKEVLDAEIRPAVAMDGGDITFGKYEDGIVYLHLQGSCSSCPSSVATLKHGVESRLREVVPQIKEVVQI
jgi:Fe-S cluster biogenesis protein NfuA